MRTSCNGCRALRKACSEDCSIRPCLEWIKTSESQGNATLFLAKFYGRAGLLNLIDAGSKHLQPAIFCSLMYEACGRMVDPINGSAGLLSSGGWRLCQAAVEAVLRGAPDDGKGSPVLPLRTFDIRHTPKTGKFPGVSKASRRRFKRHDTSVAAACCVDNDYKGDSAKVKSEIAGLSFPLQRWPFSMDVSHQPAASDAPKHTVAARSRASRLVGGATQVCIKLEETADCSMMTSHERDTAKAVGGAELDLMLALNLATATPVTPMTMTRSHGAGPSFPMMGCDDCSNFHEAKFALSLTV